MDIQNADIHDNEIVPAETNADNLSARVTIEVNGHADEPKPEDEPKVTDEQEEED